MSSHSSIASSPRRNLHASPPTVHDLTADTPPLSSPSPSKSSCHQVTEPPRFQKRMSRKRRPGQWAVADQAVEEDALHTAGGSEATGRIPTRNGSGHGGGDVYDGGATSERFQTHSADTFPHEPPTSLSTSAPFDDPQGSSSTMDERYPPSQEPYFQSSSTNHRLRQPHTESHAQRGPNHRGRSRPLSTNKNYNKTHPYPRPKANTNPRASGKRGTKKRNGRKPYITKAQRALTTLRSGPSLSDGLEEGPGTAPQDMWDPYTNRMSPYFYFDSRILTSNRGGSSLTQRFRPGEGHRP